MMRPALVVSLLSVLNSAAIFIGQLAVTWLFGAGTTTDAYFAALTVPVFLFSFLGTLTVPAFIPAVTKIEVQFGKESAWRLASAVLTLFAGGGCLAAAALTIGAVPIAQALVPGMNPEGRVLAAELMRWSALLVPLMTYGQLLVSLHQMDRRFALPAWSALFQPCGILMGVVFAGRYGIRAPVIGQVLGAALQVLVLSMGLVSARKLRPYFSRQVPGLELALKMMGPSVLAITAHLLLPVVERHFASRLGPGAVTQFQLARTIGTVALLTLSSGITATVFPRLADLAAREDMVGAVQALNRALSLFSVLAVPVVVFLSFHAMPVSHLVLARGTVSPDEAMFVARLLPWFLTAGMAIAVAQILARAFYSLLNDAKTVAWANVSNFVLFLTLCYFVGDRFQGLGLAVAFLWFWGGQAVRLVLSLRQRLPARSLRPWWSVQLRSTLAALAGGAVSLVACAAIRTLVPTFAALFAGMAAGSVTYLYVAARVLKIESLREFRSLIGSRS